MLKKWNDIFDATNELICTAYMKKGTEVRFDTAMWIMKMTYSLYRVEGHNIDTICMHLQNEMQDMSQNDPMKASVTEKHAILDSVRIIFRRHWWSFSRIRKNMKRLEKYYTHSGCGINPGKAHAPIVKKRNG